MEQRLKQLEQRLVEHKTECTEWFEKTQICFNDLAESQSESNKNVNTLIEETRDVVKFQRDLKGVVRVGTNVQKLGLWLIKWPLIGGGLYTIGKFVYEFSEKAGG